jgi:hypothetical protein
MEIEQKNDQKDPALWSLAKRRVAFKSSLVYYFVINGFLWILWLFTSYKNYDGGIPWPAWSTVGWGIGMIIEYFSVYKFPRENATEKEYRRLKGD